MGKTVPSYRMALEYEIASWREFEKALDSQDREAFEQLMDASRNHCMAAGNPVGPVVFEAMTMSILYYQQRKLDRLFKKRAALIKRSTLASYQRAKCNPKKSRV